MRRVTAVTYIHCCRVQNLLYVRGSEPTYEFLLCSIFAPFNKYGVAQQQDIPESTSLDACQVMTPVSCTKARYSSGTGLDFVFCHRADMVVPDGRDKRQSQPPDNEASTPSRLFNGSRLAKRASPGFLAELFRCLQNPRKPISYNVWQPICPLRTMPEEGTRTPSLYL